MLNKNNQHGFGIVAVILLVVVLAVIGFVAVAVMKGNDTKKQDTNKSSYGGGSTQSADEKDLVIYNFGLKSLDSVNVTTQATREFTTSGHKGFYVFGDKLPGTPVRHNPNFEFASLKEDTTLVSAINGVVVHIQAQTDSNDSEVFLAPSDNSRWVVGYDHVVNVAVTKGSTIKVGDVIGKPARQNNGLLRFEFQINKKSNGDENHICPSTLVDSSIKESLLGQLTTMQNAWEKQTSLELYDLSAQNPVGCLQKEMTPAYAEGRS